MSKVNDQNQIVPTPWHGLSKHDSSLVRRGLDQLSKPARKKGRVLLVANQEAVLEVAEQLLLADGYEVRCTRQPLEAVGLAKTFQPDVTLLELLMPVMDGIRLGRDLSDCLPRTKIVLWIQSDLLGSDQLEAFQREGYDFASLPAPFEREELLKKVESWVRDAENLDFVTGFGLVKWFSFLVWLETVLHEGEDPPENFSIVFFEIVEHWPEGIPSSSRVRRNLFGELAHGVKQICLQHLQHQLFDCFRHENRFAVLLNREPRDCAQQLVAKLKTLVEDTSWCTLIACTAELSGKFAVVSFPEDGRTEEELIRKGGVWPTNRS